MFECHLFPILDRMSNLVFWAFDRGEAVHIRS
jgi:hypothetical protein